MNGEGASTVSRKVRVLFLINDLSRAGAETQLVGLARTLDPRAYDVHVTLLKRRNDFEEHLARAGISTTALHRRGFWDLDLLRRLFRHLRGVRPDVVHSFLFLSNVLGAIVARLAGVPHVVVCQQASYEKTLSWPLRAVARWGHRFADRVIVVSREALEEEAASGQPRARLVYIPNAAPTTEADAQENPFPNRPIVLAVGQLSAPKGHRYLLDAWPHVSKAHPDAFLAFIGDGPLRAALEHRTRDLGVAETVRFFGFQPRPAPFVSACHVFVQPSLTEGTPLALLEAMALGKAVVATAVGGNRDLIVDGETGRLVPPADPQALADAISALLDSPSLRQDLGRAARSRVDREFTLTAVTAATEGIYHSLIGRRSGPRSHQST